jgi:demethylmenaquinone methyltransferase / 2-methoxy-6-polyprenyl-1,4-benzoquinol methylase
MTHRAPARASLPGSRPAGAEDEASATRQVREMFSGIAPRYDLLNHLLSLGFDIRWRRRLARHFHALLARRDRKVLDLCCGTGDLTLALAAEAGRASAGSRGEILGADFAHPMLLRARAKSASGAGRPRVEFLEADALALPFADGSFDLVTVAFGFRNLANYGAGLAEVRRVLRRGGWVAILEFTEPEGALFGRLFRFYFHRVLPKVGAWVSGNGKAYGYLPRSVVSFPRPAELAGWMTRTGFGEVSFTRWTGGIVAVHIGRR